MTKTVIVMDPERAEGGFSVVELLPGKQSLEICEALARPAFCITLSADESSTSGEGHVLPFSLAV